jgi:putative aminopeptidase FrvX
MKILSCYVLFFFFYLAIAAPAAPQARKAGVPGSLTHDLQEFVETPAIPGYEKELAAKIRAHLAGYSTTVDSIGNVILTLGSGAPRRLLVAPMDEPGFVVSSISEEGYLRVQRLPQNASLGLFDELYIAQPVRIETPAGKWIDGVVAGLSVHLQPGRLHPPSETDPENIYVDVGASSTEEARRFGADLLSPIALDRSLYEMGFGKLTAPAVGDRFGDAALVELLRRIDPAKLKGTLTVVFVAQQWAGARGLARILESTQADELIYVGRLVAGEAIAGAPGIRRAPRREPGSGAVLGLPETGESLTGFAADIKKLADGNKISLITDYSAPLLPTSYSAPPSLPVKWVHLGIATAWPLTPAELVDSKDLRQLVDLLESYITGSPSKAPEEPNNAGLGSASNPKRPTSAPATTEILRQLVETYGVSGHEGAVRDRVKSLLPSWARTETDDAGNLILRVGTPAAGTKAPRILVVAHLDEIGFEVRSISKDGRLEVEWRGGGASEFFAGHAALVHTAGGEIRPGVMELPSGWDQPEFEWPRGRQVVLRVDVGARSPAEVEQLHIKVGDWVTIPKKYRTLAGRRANGRSFDDRVGCAALIAAAWALGPGLKGRDVTFVWSTGEEVGLVGAAALAKGVAAEGRAPDYVFGVDTFVSSDSPLESKRFADAKLGGGFVIRAIDNSNIAPRSAVEKLIGLARANQIPVQYGVTGGGNDGSAFLRYGSIDVAMGWPLRYAHSAAEVIDTRDLDALTHIVVAVAKSW